MKNSKKAIKKHIQKSKLYEFLQGTLFFSSGCVLLNVQKLPVADVLQNRSARKFRKFLWKTSELESGFNKVVDVQVFKPFFYGTPPVAASKISLGSADILLMCSLIFLLPEAILNAVNTTVKTVTGIQCELHLQLTLIFGFI